MRVLVIDNDTHYKKRMAALLQGLDTVTIQHQEISPELLDSGFDLIVLTGTQGRHSAKYDAETFWANESELIRTSEVPIIGVCLGAQLMAHIFGARLSVIPGNRRIKGLKRIYNIKKTPFTFFRYNGGRVFVSQRWRITELPDELEPLCASAEGIDVFRHKTRSIYGVQFHPERRAEDNDGARIFFTIVKQLTGYESPIIRNL